jgi:hypothetical protein
LRIDSLQYLLLSLAKMLTVRDNRRSRSKSPGGRDRDRSHSRDTRARSPPKAEHKKKSIKISISESESEESDHRSRDKKSSKKYYDSESEEDRRRQKKSSTRYSESESEESDRKAKSVTITKKYYESDHEDRKPAKKEHKPAHRHRDSESESDRRKEKSKRSSKKRHDSDSSSEEDAKHRHSSKYREEERRRAEEDRRRAEEERRRAQYAGYAQPPQYAYAQTGQLVPVVPVVPPPPQANYLETRHMSYVNNHPLDGYGHTDVPDHQRTHSISVPGGHAYTQGGRYDYAQPDAFKSKKDDSNTVYQTKKGGPEYVKTYDKDGKAKLVEVKPETKNDRERERYGDNLSSRMSHLAVGGVLGAGALTVATQGGHEGGRPPASPLLEAYRGTYQSISPMPFIARAGNDDDLSDLELSGSEGDRELVKTTSRHRESDVSLTIISPSSTRKRVSFYDPADDAKKIAAALAGTHHAANVKPLINILPALSTDDILALRVEYKSHAKVAGQGINIAKHIKMRIPGNLGKAVYATALGRWESEAYWANSWYQGGSTRRELLIESLMGRSNSDIREIKNSFKDKRYGDDLEKCMKAELKADKFRVAILLALEERRMSDSTPLDLELIKRDVVDLSRILTSREGGETAMIQIIVVRSNAHLKEMMQVFELTYHRNFAREMIGKSQNLVVSSPPPSDAASIDTAFQGETLAHILNGALNRPMRDALLLHQAISETAPGKERAELLISRLVRLHWEPKHLERVKLEYEKRYRIPVEVSIRQEIVEVAKGDDAKQWGEFCIELAKSSSR